MVTKKTAVLLLVCLFAVVLSGWIDSNPTGMHAVWTLRMIVFGAGGVCGAVVGLIWWAITKNSAAEKPKSLPKASLIGGVIGAYVSLGAWLVFWYGWVGLNPP